MSESQTEVGAGEVGAAQAAAASDVVAALSTVDPNALPVSAPVAGPAIEDRPWENHPDGPFAGMWAAFKAELAKLRP